MRAVVKVRSLAQLQSEVAAVYDIIHIYDAISSIMISGKVDLSGSVA